MLEMANLLELEKSRHSIDSVRNDRVIYWFMDISLSVKKSFGM